ncbi:protein trichome berefringence-like 7 isoform X1 [Cucurbita maxima]|uniref:Protein trichome berefringence-like 7 isoform X1 n=1 Tax=Cucurbita maxima TaxID=3661 RepID=A0A6J1L290_CUCMA|nr:protein trichome berefringence-like 7 isoform X1 [Cucurbita maxima]
MVDKMSNLSKNMGFNKSVSFGRRALSSGSPRVSRVGWISRWYHVFIGIGFLVSSLLVITAGYIHVLPALPLSSHHNDVSKSSYSNGSCNMYEGNWILDDSYPLYNATECPFAEKGFDCLGNGRVDQSYLKWRWKPMNCDVPKFDVQNVLEKLRSKRIVFVGDSMSRTQWESLICLLMSGVEDKRSVYEMNGNTITKRIKYLGVRFSSFNFTVEFFRSVFLVQEGPMPKHSPKRVKSALKLDVLNSISSQWIDSDVLVFNTGHWWVPGKLFEIGCYFQVGNSLKLGMSIPTAFEVALRTWASWIEENIDTNRTHVFFRTFEPSHWKDHTFKYCSVTDEPVNETRGREKSIFSDTILEVAKNMKAPINVLRITSMSAFRSDAHVGQWSDNPSVPDCSHWCLPGVPDVWNQILVSYLLTEYDSVVQRTRYNLVASALNHTRNI